MVNTICVECDTKSLLSEKDLEERDRLVIAPSLPRFPYEKGKGDYLNEGQSGTLA